MLKAINNFFVKFKGIEINKSLPNIYGGVLMLLGVSINLFSIAVVPLYFDNKWLAACRAEF